jgi:CheY-like chemotaxis protein
MNNILAPMLMIPPMLRTRLLDNGDQDLLAMLEAGAHRGANIVRQLLTFSRGLDGERGPVQVVYLMKEMVNIMRETFPREIAVVRRAGPETWPVVADSTQLHQVLMNLCVNARDAMPHGGTLTLEAQNVTLGPDAPQLHPAARAGAYVVLTVADTGQGIAPEHLDRIFDPFFTTKEIGRGTGLGLSTVLGIVKSHGGFVTVDSTPGQGSVFKIFLPGAPELCGPNGDTPTPRSPAGGGRLVLVVDDEPAVREALRRVLEKFGYKVLTAGNGYEALEIFRPRQAEIHAVLTDVMMPAMNGVTLVRELRALAPELPIVAATGLDQSGDHDALTALGVVDIIQKPCQPDDVLEALDRLQPAVN